MPKSNEDSSVVSLNKLERPPLKRPKTLSIPSSSSSSSTSTSNRRFDLGVSIENGSPASNHADFPNEQWKYPSFLGTTRRKRTTVKPSKIQDLQFSNSMGSKIGADHKKAGIHSSVVQAPPPNSSSSSSSSSSTTIAATITSSTSCSSSTSTSIVTLQDHSSTTRRPHQNKHTSILYLVSDLFALDVIIFYLLFSPVLVKKNHFK